MNVIIRISTNDGSKLIKYKHVKSASVQDLRIIVKLCEHYEVENKKLLKEYNTSTTPYVHVYYNARIVACYN